jgi:hypothetical protein
LSSRTDPKGILKIKKDLHLKRYKSLNCYGSGGWIRTNDLRVMSPTSYQTAPPRDEWISIASNKLPVNGIFHPNNVKIIFNTICIASTGAAAALKGCNRKAILHE